MSCETCDIKYNDDKGKPSNLAVRECNTCFENPYKFDQSTQPECKQGFVNLNVLGLQEYPNFIGVEQTPCGGLAYTSKVPDSKARDPARGTLMYFDRPPLVGQVNSCNVYDEKYRGYGSQYRTYSDINTGQIQYYYDRSREDAYYEPIYDIESNVDSYLYRDPMGVVKPVYSKCPSKNGYNCPFGQAETQYGCDTWTNDSSMHREDIMSRQQMVHNQQRWMPRWPVDKK